MWSGKSNTHGHASSKRDTHRHRNDDSFADGAIYTDSTTTPHPGTAPVT